MSCSVFLKSIAILTVMVASARANSYQFIEISYPGAGETIVTGISDSGLVVGTYGPSMDIRRGVEVNRRGFVHNLLTGTYSSIQPFGSVAVNVNSINNNGLIVGDYLTGTNRLHGFVYNTATSEFVDILPSGVNAQEATISDVDDNGVLIGSFSTNVYLSNPSQDGLNSTAFRALPQGDSYQFQAFAYPLTTATFGGGRNAAGLEIGTAINQSGLGSDAFGYSRATFERYDFPEDDLDFDEGVLQTGLSTLNNAGLAIGNAGIQSGTFFDLAFRNQAFLVSIDSSGNIQENSMIPLQLPCSSCVSPVNSTFTAFEESGRSIATNLNEAGMIVGYNDENDGIYRGFVGIPLPESGLAGDFDNDQDIDGRDFLAWQRGESTTPFSVGDLLLWREGYGSPGAIVTQAIAVPEPVCSCLVAACLLGGILKRSYRTI